MMEQATDAESSPDKSFNQELGNAKFELNALIDEISEVCLICVYSISPDSALPASHFYPFYSSVGRSYNTAARICD